MTRWIVLAVLVVVLSAAATVVVQFLPESSSPSGAPKDFPVVPAGPAPLAVVKEPLEYDFGTMAQRSRGSKAWTIRNEGESDLKIFLKSTTCKCTVANLGKDGKATIKPGEETKIPLEWETKELQDKFAQSATIGTNDPTHEEIVFRVVGLVQPPIVMVPPEPAVYLLNVPNDAGALANKAIFSKDRPHFQITNIVSSRPELIEGAVKPLDAASLKGFGIEAGHHLEVKVRPSTGLGPFSAELVLTTDHPSLPELKIAVTGKLVGAITPTPEEVRLTGVSGEKGGATSIILLVRGQDRTAFEVEKIPAGLKVEINPVDQQPKVAEGADPARALRQYRLTVTVPPGSDPGEIDGAIVLKTDHPHAGRVTIPVRVLIAGAG